MLDDVTRREESDRALLCRAGAILCALRLPHVIETLRPLPIRPLGGMPPFVRGLAVIRGIPVPVVDAATLLGTGPSEPRRFITVRTGERVVALAVEEIVGIRELGSLSVQDLPPLLHRIRPRVVTLVGMLDANLVVVLRDARIVPDRAWTSRAGSGDESCPQG